MPSLPDPLVRLVLPFRADESANPTLAVVALVVVAALVAWSVAATVPVFEATVSGTTTVDNPSYPGDVLCENDAFERKPGGCDDPKTVEKDLGAHAAKTASNLVVPFGLAVVFGWLIAAAVVWAFTGASEGAGTFRDVLAGTAWGFVPFLLPAAARPFYVESAARAADSPETLDGVAAAVRSVLVGFESGPLTLLSFVALAWSAYVVAGTTRQARGVTRERAVLVTFGPAVLLGTLSPVGNAVGSVPGEVVGYGVVFALVGAPLLAAPRGVIELNKRTELVGFRNTRQVEPEEWYVALHRFGGLTLVGLGYAFTGGPSLLV